MANTILWNARPTAEALIAADGVLKNLAAAGVATCAADVANGTDLYTHADFLLYVHDFAAAPAAGRIPTSRRAVGGAYRNASARVSKGPSATRTRREAGPTGPAGRVAW